MTLPHISRSRRHPTHGVLEFPNRPTVVFLTICTRDREAWLATAENHALLHGIWSTEATAWCVGRYVLMPDHLHLVATPGAPELPLDNWVRYWKSRFTRRHGDPAHRWQADHWDTRLRHEESYEEKWQYVVNNPVRHGLVRLAEDWPYQGEVFDLRW